MREDPVLALDLKGYSALKFVQRKAVMGRISSLLSDAAGKVLGDIADARAVFERWNTGDGYYYWLRGLRPHGALWLARYVNDALARNEQPATDSLIRLRMVLGMGSVEHVIVAESSDRFEGEVLTQVGRLVDGDVLRGALNHAAAPTVLSATPEFVAAWQADGIRHRRAWAVPGIAWTPYEEVGKRGEVWPAQYFGQLEPPDAPASAYQAPSFAGGFPVAPGTAYEPPPLAGGLGDDAQIEAILKSVSGQPLSPQVLRKILGGFGNDAMVLDPVGVEQTLFAKVAEYRQLQDRLRAVGHDDPTVLSLRQDAAELLQQAEFDAADDLLAEAERLDIEAKVQVDAEAHKRRMNAAESRAGRAAAARLRLAYREAAEHYAEAARIVAPVGGEAKHNYRLSQAEVLCELGEKFGDNGALAKAVAIYAEKLLPQAFHEPGSDQWAAIQNKLGVALQVLGSREADTTRLEEAIGAFREALKVYTRERTPQEWAATLDNLGNTHRILGAREEDPARLEAAVAEYREALQERTRERAPRDWASTQDNLGVALEKLGEREAGTARLEQAIAAYGEALTERTRARMPLEWALTQNHLGNALWSLGRRKAGTATLERAVAAFHEALKENRHDRAPLAWATTQSNLSNALVTLGERESGVERLQEAVTSCREALRERTYERMPYYWARTQECLAVALLRLGERVEAETNLPQSLAALDKALAVYRTATASYDVQAAERLRRRILDAVTLADATD